MCDQVEQSIRRQIPRDDLAGILDNIGFPYSGINLTLSNSGVIGTSDAEILISLTPDHRTKPVDYIRTLRRTLPREFPGTEFYFQPADIVSQVLNFGLPGAHRRSVCRAQRATELRSGAQRCCRS